MIKQSLYIITVVLLFFTACKSSINTEDLYGKWKYIKVENSNANPPDSVSSSDLQAQAPSIEFTKKNDLVIMWGGKVLSHGKFKTDGKNIRYTESLPDGKTREFPFWVMKLTDKEIVFETIGADGSRVTAMRE